MSTLEERRAQRRRKSSDAKASAVSLADATAPAETKEAARAGTAEAAAKPADARPAAAETATSDASPARTEEATPRRGGAEKAEGADSINFAAYLRHAVSQAPEQPALIHAARGIAGDAGLISLNARELDERSDALARGFAAAGWARGQRVVLVAEPSADALTCVFALIKLGAVPVVIEPGRSRQEVAACAEQALASVVLASPSGIVKRFLARGPFKNARTTVLIGAELPMPLPGIRALASYRKAEGARLSLAPTRAAEPALIMFTSGASGPSRAVVLDHAALIAQAEATRRSLGLNSPETVLCGDLLLAMLLVVTGRTVVMPGLEGASSRTVEKLLAAIDAHGVTTVLGSPVQWRAVAEHCTRVGRMLPNVRQVLLVGGPAGLATHAAIQAVLPSGECRAIHSMTEAFPVAIVSARETLGDAAATTEKGGGHCLGRILPGVDVAVIDFGVGSGRQVESGEVGEICLKGARVALSEARAAGPWTRTGDIGWVDRQDRLWIIGNVRRTAHTRFGPIYNEAAEALFELHPRVRHAVIVPLGQAGQQEAVLVVQPLEGRQPKDDPDRLEFERELLHAAESHQVTRGIRRVVFRKDLPRDARFGAQTSIRELAGFIQGRHGA